MVIAFSGYNNQDLNFGYEDSSSYWSCGLTFMGEFYVFGGKDSHVRQVRKLSKTVSANSSGKQSRRLWLEEKGRPRI